MKILTGELHGGKGLCKNIRSQKQQTSHDPAQDTCGLPVMSGEKSCNVRSQKTDEADETGHADGSRNGEGCEKQNEKACLLDRNS